MIPARIGQSKKKIYDLSDGEYFGVWQDYFCWLKDESGKVIYRFDTSTQMRKRENVRVIFKVPYAHIYEIFKKPNT